MKSFTAEVTKEYAKFAKFSDPVFAFASVI